MDSVESAGGRLGAVLSAPLSGPVTLGPTGPWLATTPAQARQVLTDTTRFDFPGDITRSGDLSGSTGETRSGHTLFASPTPEQVAEGTATFAREWRAALAHHDRATPEKPYDAMRLLRRPVSRSTTAAVLPGLDSSRCRHIADLSLDWIDALAPVIARGRPPRRWSRIRRTESDTRHALEDALEDALAALPAAAGTPAEVATLLAAGIQVPIAAGAWLLAWLAQHPQEVTDPVHAVWETLRLTPPTWVTARITTEPVDVDGQQIPAGRVILVSPLLLGRLPDLVPTDSADTREFAPDRWDDGARRPGAWLPFGAGPHACPGRSLGMAQLVHLAQWGVDRELHLSEQVGIDQSRGISPSPCRFTVASRRESSS